MSYNSNGILKYIHLYIKAIPHQLEAPTRREGSWGLTESLENFGKESRKVMF